MSYSIAEIATATGLEAEGDLSLRVAGVAEPATAGPDRLALAMDKSFARNWPSGGARAAVLWAGADWRALGLEAALFAPRARVALAEIGDLFARPLDLAPGIHPSAVVDTSAKIAADAAIGPFCVVGAGVTIGPGARILCHCTIAQGARIGRDCLLHAGVRIGAGVEIGDRFIAQPNAVIGADGFSYVTPEPGSVESAKRSGRVAADSRNSDLRRINSLGSVRIGDDVELGACSSIDRGTVADTVIGDMTKIDNQVQLGHNVQVGDMCLICGHVGVAGSVEIGDRVVLGGKVGIGDHLTIGSDAVVAGGSLVGSNIRAGTVMIGVPAMPRDRFGRQLMDLRRLPRLIEDVKALKAQLGL